MVRQIIEDWFYTMKVSAAMGVNELRFIPSICALLLEQKIA